MPYTAWALQKATRSHEIQSPDLVASAATGRPNACNMCHLDQTLDWTATHLERWYGMPKIDLEVADRSVAAGVHWLVAGDAGQRALITWAMGWDSAQRAAGSSWMAPYLALQLSDPYAAIRFAALRSVRTLPGLEDFAIDAVSPSVEATEPIGEIFWSRRGAYERRNDPRILIDAKGGLDRARYNELRSQRNHRRVSLME